MINIRFFLFISLPLSLLLLLLSSLLYSQGGVEVICRVLILLEAGADEVGESHRQEVLVGVAIADISLQEVNYLRVLWGEEGEAG